MNIKVIHSEAEYESALAAAGKLMDAEPDTPDADMLEVLAVLIGQYEDKAYPMEAPSALDALKFRMEQMGASQADLAALLGSKSRASELLRGKRPLNMKQARTLYQEWHVSAAALLSGDGEKARAW